MMINLNSIVLTMAQRKISYYCGSFLGNDIYYLKEFVDIMINVIGEEQLVEMLIEDQSPNKIRLNKIGKEWSSAIGMKNKLKKFDKLIEKTKIAYDILENSTLKKKDRNYSNFISKASKISAIKEDFYALAVFLITSTSISKYSLKPEDIKVMENKGYKVIKDFDKERLKDDNNNKKQ